MNQVYTHGGRAVDDPVAFLDCPNTVCSYGGWYFLGKNQDQSVEMVYEPITNTGITKDYSTYGFSYSSIFSIYEFTPRKENNLFMYYYRNRYYESISGRFLQYDEAEISGIYTYVENNPINLTDPFGLYVCSKWEPTNRRVPELRRKSDNTRYVMPVGWNLLILSGLREEDL